MERLRRPMRPEPQARFELDTAGRTTLIVDTFGALFQTRNRIIEIRGTAPKDPAAEVVVTLDEYPLRRELYAYSWRILQLTIVISVVTAALMFVSLRWLLVRPLEQLDRKSVVWGRSVSVRVVLGGGRNL